VTANSCAPFEKSRILLLESLQFYVSYYIQPNLKINDFGVFSRKKDRMGGASINKNGFPY
jgi:hypothetical protein